MTTYLNETGRTLPHEDSDQLPCRPRCNTTLGHRVVIQPRGTGKGYGTARSELMANIHPTPPGVPYAPVKLIIPE